MKLLLVSETLTAARSNDARGRAMERFVPTQCNRARVRVIRGHFYNAQTYRRAISI